ncbi:hypothetical protein SAMN05444487_1218 [Marininema mesophilum]|uniref:Stage VI sporulation protein F n=1 Tax=Marininema mesophilum TaxID=1048340 RepID=A0A1H3C9L6_9BACL|nr:hypothetical protein [Marininema mesophilum]SDX50803.1 hypothetical protein SAMN05444487_1218 [Marininema mesophilum]
MKGKGPNHKEMTQLINTMMGKDVLTEKQLGQILEGARRANERGGMSSVLDYLMKVTQADVDKKELTDFADSVRNNPDMGMDLLKGKRGIPNSNN